MCKKRCTECKENVLKIWRNYKNRRFCSKCYIRMFKLGNCTKCQKSKRLPIFNKRPVCIDCERDMPCIRCGKEIYKVGKVTEYGTVCNYCSIFFRKKKCCELCGNYKRGVSKYKSLGHNLKICGKCYRKSLFATCRSCHRHRILQLDESGKMVCNKCFTIGKIKCIKCGDMKPAGYGKRCIDCYWRELFNKRVKINTFSFNSKIMINHFVNFSKWLVNRKGYNFSAIKINRFVIFFNDIESTWGYVPEYRGLLEHFSANGLRVMRLPMIWLEEILDLRVDERIKKEFSEKSMVSKLINTFPVETIYYNLISDYHLHLMNKVKRGKTSIRSARLALTPAVNLLKLKNLKEPVLPSQRDVDNFLLQVPGQKAGITGFLNFINKNSQLKLIPIVDVVKINKYKRLMLEREMLNLMNNIDKTKSYKKNWIITSLQYFHRVPKNKALKIMKGIIANEKTGMSFSLGNADYFIPYPSKTYFNIP